MHRIRLEHLPVRINNPMESMSPEGIILHYVGNPSTSALANARYFHNVNSKTSVNYIVDDVEIVEIIPPNMKSYGTKDGEYNSRYIQIEMCHPDSTGRIGEKTLENVVWLCAKLMLQFDIEKVIRHYDVTGKRCPRWFVYHSDEWNELKERIKGEFRKMSYEQFCEYMKKYEEEKASEDVSEYAKEAWEKICDMKVMDESDPKKPLLREQLAAVLDRLGII